MNELKIFENPEFGKMRTLAIDGEPWIVGRDAAMMLGYAKPENAVSVHVDEEDKTSTLIQGSGSNYKSKTVIINESGLYSLILSSRLPGAKRFKRRETSDVIPSIRKNGVYATPETVEHLLGDPDFAIQTFTALKEEREKRMALELENARQKTAIAVMEPKADYHDIILQCKDLVPISVIAKDYGWSAIRMNKYLHEKGVQYKRGDTWVLYQKYAECGYTGTKTHEFKDDYDCSHAKIQTY